MHWLRLSPFVGLLGVLAVGCRPQLAPDQDAILYYLRNARVQGEVKRVWPEGQKYVDKILKADAGLQKEVSRLAVWQRVEALWPRDDPRWPDVQQLSTEIKALDELLTAGRKKREELLGGLRKAVEDVPPTLKLSESGKTEFVQKVWEELAPAEPEIAATAQTHVRLFRAVRAAAGDFDPQGPGLKFNNSGTQQQIDQSYRELEERLRQQREGFLQYAEQALTARPPRSEDVRQRRYEGFRRTYLRKQLEALPKGLQVRIEKAQAEIEALQRPLPKPLNLVTRVRAAVDVEIEVRKRLVERDTAERERLRPRVEAILKKSQESTR